MSEWKEIELFQIMEIVKNQFQADKNSDFKYIGLEHIEQESLRLNSFGHSSEVSSNKFFFKKGDILFGKLRPYFRKVIKTKFDGVCSTDIWVIRSKDKIFQDYLFYFLANWEFVNIANAGEGGSRMPRADWNFLKNTKWLIPNLEEQKAIAEVLTSLDDKIDLLHKQNKTLEQLAETLFRHHFIDNAQDDWEVGKLGDCVTISYGKNLPTNQLLESGYPVFGGNGQIGFFDKFLYADPQVLVSCRGEASGKVNISLPNSFVTNNSLVLVRDKKPEISFEFLKYFALNYDFSLHVSGSAQPQITIDGLYDAEFVMPSSDLVKEYSNVVGDIEEKRLLNFYQIKNLEKLRDQLLPKLMSGEITTNLISKS